MYVCVYIRARELFFYLLSGNSASQGQRDVFILAGCDQRLREKNAFLGSRGILSNMGLTAGLLSPLRNDLNPLHLYLTTPFIGQLYLTSAIWKTQQA